MSQVIYSSCFMCMISKDRNEIGVECMTNFSIRRPVFTIVVMILFIIMGIVSSTRLPLQLIPDIEPPVAAVVTSYPNAGPEEVLSEVTEPIENQLSRTTGLELMQSNSMEGTS